MAKKTMNDLVVKPKSSKIQYTTGEQTIIPIKEKMAFYPERTTPRMEYPQTNPPRSKIFIWIVAMGAFLFLLFSFSLIFTSANVSITPKYENFPVDNSFTAEKNSKNNLMSFELMSIKAELSETLPADKVVDLEKKAKGTIILYNSFGSSAQKLLIDTRLLGGNGKIYKTDKAVTIPGASVKNGETVPGSVEVGIYADKPGEEYNSEPMDFTIVGFKNSPKYTKFYGRSKGSIADGFKGTTNVVDEEKLLSTKESLKTKLKDKLMADAKSQIPTGFLFYEEASFISFEESDNAIKSKDSSVPVSVKGVLSAFIFNQEKLEEEIATKVALLEKRDDGAYSVIGLKELEFKMPGRDNIVPENTKSFNFSMSGGVIIIWPVDTKKIALQLVDQKKKDFQNILMSFDNIDKAEVVISPFWKSSFPKELKKIKINVLGNY